jgi:DNA-binding transcriptional ArsR family regulator
VAVHELARGFAISRPAVSQHLRILRDCELIKEDRVGRERLYRLDPVPLQRVGQWVKRYEQFWTERLVALGHVLDSDL